MRCCSEAARSVVGLQRRGKARQAKRAWRRKPGKSEGRLKRRGLKMRGRERNLTSKTLFPHWPHSSTLSVRVRKRN